MWPLRVPEPVLAEIERKLGSSGVAGQLQQRPSPRGGGIVKRVWFERSYVSRLNWPRRFEFLGISVDASVKGTETASYGVIQAGGCVEAGRYLLGQRRGGGTRPVTPGARAPRAGAGVAESVAGH